MVLDILRLAVGLLPWNRAAAARETAAAAGAANAVPKAGPPFLTGWVVFYTRRLYQRIEDCWNRPIAGEASARIQMCVRERVGRGDGAPLVMTGEKQDLLNLGSYNYLGFGGIDERCTPAVEDALRDHGVTACSSRLECGETSVHVQLEATVAKFLDKEAALVVGMGFATNSTLIPVLVDPSGNGKGVLVLSDALNHSSIVEGVRGSGCKVQPFAHNDMEHLEAVLRHATEHGQPNGQSWRKIIIMIEGIYSMEGEFCRLREIVALKKKYSAYLYLDEAHSIGAVGPRGRGVTDLLNVPTEEVDVMMGTFTKSFGSVGGYVAASQEVVDMLRRHSAGFLYAPAMSPPAAAQALSAFEVIMGTHATAGDLGQRKILQLRANSNRLREGLVKMGCRVLGDLDSPVIPIMLYHPEKICAFSRACLKRGLAVVVVGYPATPLLLSRARLCVSASHTNEQIDLALELIESAGKEVGILYERSAAQRAVRLGLPLDVQAKERTKELRVASMTCTSSDLVGASITWVPEPLCSSRLPPPGKAIQEGKDAAALPPPALELRRTDFARMSVAAEPREAAAAALRKYGCGTCGPRGFYGTLDVHLELEDALAGFLGTEQAIVYSFGIATISSVVPAFVRKGDLLYVDEGVHFCAAVGCTLARGATRAFPHQDYAALEEQLRQQAAADLVLPPHKRHRLFLLVEGVYACDGSLADLPTLLRLRDTYGCYLIVDETLSFGALGKTGRGISEHFGLAPSCIDVLVGSLEHSLASVGGFCAGNRMVVSHQRLSGTGYCFSASLPAYATCAALAALKLLDEQPERLTQLAANSAALHAALVKHVAGCSPLIEVHSDKASPVAHVALAPNSLAPEAAEALLLRASEAARKSTGAAALLQRHSAQAHVQSPRAASLRLTAHCELDAAQLDAAAAALGAALVKEAAALKEVALLKPVDAISYKGGKGDKADVISRSASQLSSISDPNSDSERPTGEGEAEASNGKGGAAADAARPGEVVTPVTVPLLAFLELGRCMLRRYMQQQMKWHEFTVLPFIHRLRASRSTALHVLFSVGHFFGSESFYFCAIPVAAWSTVGESLPVPGIVTFFVVNLYVGNYLKNLFALPRPTASPGGPKEEDFGWPSMYAVNAVGLPFFALRYVWGAVGTGTPLSAHYQLVTAASYTAAFLWAGVVCGARLYSGVSSPADVQGGMLVGGVLVRLWLPICDRANAWIVDPEAALLGAPPWLALLAIATLMVLLHPFTPRDPRSWTAIVYSVKAVAFGYSFIVGSNACVRLAVTAAAPPPLDSAYALLLLLLRNVIGFCCLGTAWAAASLVSSRLERGVRKVLPRQRHLPKCLRNLFAFSALGGTISLGAPLVFQRLGI